MKGRWGRGQLLVDPKVPPPSPPPLLLHVPDLQSFTVVLLIVSFPLYLNVLTGL